MKFIPVFIFACLFQVAYCDNQTETLSPIHSPEHLPFRVSVELADFSLPNGIHSYASAIFDGKWIFIAGRTNGLHGFGAGPTNFPPQQQNTVVYVVDPIAGVTFLKSLNDPSSGLSQKQIDTLSVTSPQSYQSHATLYMTGGYGVDTATGNFSTKDKLTAINIPGLIRWVTNPFPGETAAEHIRQITHPIFQVTGGYMTPGEDDLTLLIFGQNFTGFYTDSSNGSYTNRVRRFRIMDDGVNLAVQVMTSEPEKLEPSFRRRDLNVVPIIYKVFGEIQPAFVAFSGVFTLTTGVWTVPVIIFPKGNTLMPDPANPKTFKQGMNNYVCPTVGLFSKKHSDMYVVFFGGISFGFFQNGTFQTDPEIPFINQITTVKMNSQGFFKQYLMDAEYPVILSTQSNPGNQLLFGAGAAFIPARDMPMYDNAVLKLDKLGKDPIVIGYIVGGIQSTLPNTNVITDSAASPYVFRVILEPK